MLNTGFILRLASLAYPLGTGYMANLRAGLRGVSDRWWTMRSRRCPNAMVSAESLESDTSVPEGAQVEHTLPLVAIARFTSVANHGRQWAPRPAGSPDHPERGGQITPQGRLTETPAVGNQEFWENVWNNAQGLPANLPAVTDSSPDLRRPVDRLYEATGSNTNARHFTLLAGPVNAIKGRLEIFNRPMAIANFRRYVRSAVDSDTEDPDADIQRFMAPLRETRGVFQYLQADDVVTRLDATASSILSQLQIIELNIADAEGLSAHWNEFYPYYFSQVSEFARTWGSDQVEWAIARYEANPRAYNREEVLKELKEIQNDIPNWKYAFED
ncbi:hypothetical protein K4F52_009406 [Lecanicillium sp. MT-2017a]|nr:hypothetical protein K4F52_009406 [Lecanicillium sp. MT-2017a]